MYPVYANVQKFLNMNFFLFLIEIFSQDDGVQHFSAIIGDTAKQTDQWRLREP